PRPAPPFPRARSRLAPAAAPRPPPTFPAAAGGILHFPAPPLAGNLPSFAAAAAGPRPSLTRAHHRRLPPDLPRVMPAALLYSAPCEQTPRAVLVEGAPCSPCLPTIQDRLPTGVSLKKMKWKGNKNC
ncbi:unnamed protein product, partial [Urochloa humidicola]